MVLMVDGLPFVFRSEQILNFSEFLGADWRWPSRSVRGGAMR
jgi:hypothetical protein